MKKRVIGVEAMKRSNRYSRNGLTITEDDQVKLEASKVCVLGAGGLGGYIIEMLARAGVGHIKVVDGDVFDATNWNRQLLSHQGNVNQSKALAAKERVQGINDLIHIDAVTDFVDEKNCKAMIEGYDIVVDALDTISIRKMVASRCGDLDIPYVYGAIAGWYGQVATIFPKEDTLDIIYKSNSEHGAETLLGNPSFTPGLIASIEVSEVIKCLLGKGEVLTGGFLHIDLLNNEFEKIEFKD